MLYCGFCDRKFSTVDRLDAHENAHISAGESKTLDYNELQSRHATLQKQADALADVLIEIDLVGGCNDYSCKCGLAEKAVADYKKFKGEQRELDDEPRS